LNIIRQSEIVNLSSTPVAEVVFRGIIGEGMRVAISHSPLRILTFSPFLGQRQSLVRARSVLLRRPFVFNSRPQDIRSTSQRFAAF